MLGMVLGPNSQFYQNIIDSKNSLRSFKWRFGLTGLSKRSTIACLGLLLLLVVYLGQSHFLYDSENLEEHEQVNGKYQFPRHLSLKIDDYIEPTKVDTKPNANVKVRQIYTQGYTLVHPELCPYQGSELRLFVFVASAPNNFEMRQTIRQTWGHYRMRSDTEIAFMIGETNNSSTNSLILEENQIYGDLIKGTYHDSYYNLTLKTVSMLEWLGTYCSEVDFFLKTDDDMFINMDNLLKFIDSKKGEERVIYSKIFVNRVPFRNNMSKYYVSFEEYAPRVYPDFAHGSGYLMSGDCINILYGASLDETHLKLEDVFLTGIVADKVNVRRIDDSKFFNEKLKNHCSVKDKICVYGPDIQFKLWSIIFKPGDKC